MTPGEGLCYGLHGALAAFPRHQAARAVKRAGGRLRRGTSRQTSHAVFGRRLLARRDASALATLVDAERAAGRTLLSETSFLRQLGLLPEGPAGTLSRAALLDQAPLAPADFDLLALFDAFEHDADPFSFRDLILARKYAGLIAGGAGWADIARSIHRSGPALSLTAKSLALAGRAVVARDGEQLSELDGQLLLGLDPPEMDADDLFAAAEAAEAEGRHREAAVLYGRCLALDPGDAVAAFNRGNCLREAGALAEAECDYARALQSDPGLVEAWFNLGCVAAERGRPEAARRSLEQAVARDPAYADPIFNLGALAFESGDLKAARRWWTRYVEIDAASEWGRRAASGLRYIALSTAASRAG